MVKMILFAWIPTLPLLLTTHIPKVALALPSFMYGRWQAAGPGSGRPMFRARHARPGFAGRQPLTR